VTDAPKKFPDEIIELLRGQILAGEYLPGDRLPPERDLAATLGTNRNTLREALRALEAQGLVRARQGDGVRILDFRKHGELNLIGPYVKATEGEERARVLADLLRLRRLIAKEAVVLAARRARPKEINELRRLLQIMLDAAIENDLVAVPRAELALYRAITEASHSQSGLWLFNSLEKLALGLLDAYPGLWIIPERFDEEWRAVIEAIAAEDEPLAGEIIQRKLERTDEIIMKLLGVTDP